MLDPLLLAGGLIIALCLFGIAYCSLAEAAFLGMNETRLRRLAEDPHPNARRVLRLLANSNYLSALIVGMNLFVIIISTVMTLLVHHRLREGAPLTAELLHIATVLVILVFAELTPKTYGGLHPERTSLAVVRGVALLARVCRPLVLLLSGLSRPLVRLVSPRSRSAQFMTLDEIRAAADVSEEEGLVDPEEAQMLDSVFDLGETQVRGIMVPRVDIVAVEECTTVTEFAAAASSTGKSRIPIYAESLDNITGIVYVNDVLRRLGKGDTNFSLREIARSPFYVPNTKRIDELLHELRERHVHIAIVVDEFGGTDGLVTIEDILEELVGEIADEHDHPQEQFETVSAAEVIVDGKVRIEEVNEHLGTALPEEQYETVGGLVSGLAGHIPSSGETFAVADVQLRVEQSDGQHVERVRVVVGSREEGEE